MSDLKKKKKKETCSDAEMNIYLKRQFILTFIHQQYKYVLSSNVYQI